MGMLTIFLSGKKMICQICNQITAPISFLIPAKEPLNLHHVNRYESENQQSYRPPWAWDTRRQRKRLLLLHKCTRCVKRWLSHGVSYDSPACFKMGCRSRKRALARQAKPKAISRVGASHQAKIQNLLMNKQHGGKRAGAGRPKGSGKGRTVKTSSINLPPAVWDKLDSIRGDLSRSKYIAETIHKIW